MADSPYIFDATPQNFQQLVLENSHQVPVLVDFWADWCQPCKTLMPMLAKLADEYRGGFILVKVNTDQHQQLAAQFGVRNLPTVKVIKGGRIVDEFMGVQPESEIRKIINRHRVRPTEPYRQQALQMYETGNLEGAVQLMEQVVQHEPDFYEAVVELAGMLIQQNRAQEAEFMLQTVPPDAIDNEILSQLLAEAKKARLQEQVSGVDTSALEQRLAANPDDLDAMLELAKIRIATDDIEAGLELYFTVHKKNSNYQDGAGKQGLFSTFELIGAKNPLVKKYRNKLFSLIY
ncbi:MAG TPA: thioredoxin [Candidatus Thiothrix moscowensis]|uniref:thioredoxin n=1 Tax=unclassified Thiothrix TaxID=2636184 RepID=UPI001A204FD1|nr:MULTISPECIES: thioredoxin [unclassified Thiothrix]MBJ6609428.1 thioredoxin [Candidatus Thiothrix moscowensis]HRJ52002.1 thioredoxin [Candidatus Thiothrix moscowensis]HRJ92487.1 thioredoxin [Candidatus Thiothrix moscowensis]